MPAIFELVEGRGLPHPGDERVAYGSTVEHLSLAVALVLMASYGAGLLFSLRTHRDLFNPAAELREDAGTWSVRRSTTVLALAGVLVALLSDVLVGSIEHTANSLGVSQFFLGAFVVAVVGNAAEHYVAVVAAVKDKMQLAVNISIGSSAQIGLFVAPVLVVLSFLVGPSPMPFVFNVYEIAALLAAGLAASALVSDGESTWFEGLQLIALYAVIGVVFFAA